MKSKITFRWNKGLKPKNENPQFIYLRFRIGRHLDFNASIGCAINRNHWDFKTGLPKRMPATIKDYHLILARIDGLTTHFNNFVYKNEIERKQPSYIEVKEHFQSYLTKPAKKQDKVTLFGFIESFIENAKTTPNPITKKLVAKSTITSYKRVFDILKEFDNEVYRIDFDKIDYEFYTDFNQWSESKNYSRNYIGKLTKTLKTFLNEATEKGINTNKAFQSKRFTVIKEETDNIYLSIPELQNIWRLDLSNNPALDTARNLFLIGAFTGLRISDYNRLNESNFKVINGTECITVKTQKTGKVVSIPINPILKEVINKNPNLFNQKLSNPELNKHIKEVGRMAGIEEIESTTITKGGKEISIQTPKYQLITSHTARRSFCTNAFLSGMPAIDIMAISGHKTEKSFLIYIKATAEQKAQKIAEYDFFKQAPAMKVS